MFRVWVAVLLLSVSFGIFTCLPVSAFVSASNVKLIDYNKPTYVVVAGRGDELGLLFQYAALAKAAEHLKLNGQMQILFLSAEEVPAKQETMMLQQTALKEVQIVPGSLSSENIFSLLKKHKQIQAIDFYTHATIKFGMRLDSYEQRLESIDDWGSIKNSFGKYAYVFFHGCNSGFELAPKVAAILGIATMGSLTSTDFQKLSSNHEFLNADTAPNGTRWVSPHIYRMKPDNSPYLGHWGNFSTGGLGFFKTFCPNMKIEMCQQAMASMMKSWLSAAPQLDLVENSQVEKIFEQRVTDFLCHGSPNSAGRKKCELALRSQDLRYNSFQGAPLSCTFEGCSYELKCPQFDDKCTLKTPASKGNALINEYQNYKRGFELLTKANSSR